MGLTILKTYISDLSDAELMQRPSAKCNHLAWQLGHLIASEVSLLESIAPGKAATLPDGFAARHSKEQCGNDTAGEFLSRSAYEELYDQVRAATVAALDGSSDSDLDSPSPEHFRNMFPTVADIYTLIANHPTMHAGQFAVVRAARGIFIHGPVLY